MRTISNAAMLLAGLHFVAFVAIAGPSAAFADEARTPPASGPSAASGGDVIDLKNGGILRGTLIDAIPNARARIQLATGEIATVPWQEIARIEHSAATASTAAASGEGSPVWVHIDGSEGAQLQRDLNGDHRQWVTVCTAPCDKAVSPQFEYRIAGDGIRNSRVFSLSARGGEHESLSVDEASRSGFVLGIVSASVGTLVMFIGLLVVLVDAAASVVYLDTSSANSARSGEALGWGISAVGLAGLIGGVVLIASNARTGVRQSGAAAQAGSAPSDGWMRGPEFQDALRAPTPMGPLARPMGIPIFGGRF